MIEDKLNNRPRKVSELEKTPNEAFYGFKMAA